MLNMMIMPMDKPVNINRAAPGEERNIAIPSHNSIPKAPPRESPERAVMTTKLPRNTCGLLRGVLIFETIKPPTIRGKGKKKTGIKPN